jgi:toxin ParE1/3/4
MPDYRLSRSAERDLIDIWRYTYRHWGKQQANHYTRLIKTMCAHLAEVPQQAPGCGHIRPGYRQRNVEHHVIYFRQTHYGIAVIRILHERMDAAWHL